MLGLLCLDNEDNHPNPCQRHLAQARHSGEKLQTFFIVVTFSWSLASCLDNQPGSRRAFQSAAADWQVLIALRKLVKYNIEGNTGKLHLNSDFIFICSQRECTLHCGPTQQPRSPPPNSPPHRTVVVVESPGAPVVVVLPVSPPVVVVVVVVGSAVVVVVVVGVVVVVVVVSPVVSVVDSA